MKTIIKPLLLALSLTLAFVSNSDAKPGRPAVSTFKTGIYSTITGKLNIALDKQPGGPVDIQLKTANGVLLYAQRVSKKESTFRARLDLDELADGEYTLVITNGIETTRQTITLKTPKLSTVDRTIRTEVASANQ
ncbi:hypothetical protein [Spirosoma rigui]|uniref:hypothetical protein n=1 Tax=Spirosoma rigui TaxID=564064 RepID=UPI0009AFD5D3|nr:hypothetical protein [Spirosoma rigui]